jgi:hypothetical protein
MYNHDFEEVTKRLLYACDIKNQSSLARKLDVTPQVVSMWKAKNKIPFKQILILANLYGLSIDWVLSGRGEAFLDKYVEQGARQYISEEELTG